MVSVGFDADRVIRIERQPRASGGPRIVYICKCLECDTQVKIRKSDVKVHSGKCASHSHIKKPFESIYNSFKNDWRKLENTVTYEQFLNFTAVSSCHYCVAPIPWTPFAVVKNEYKGRAYFLDRKNNDLGYSTQNCVVCCTKCNLAKGNRYTYEEWYGMTGYLRNQKEPKHES